MTLPDLLSLGSIHISRARRCLARRVSIVLDVFDPRGFRAVHLKCGECR